MTREVLPVDILFVGAGPANLAAAYHLARSLAEQGKEAEIAIIEKSQRVGGHILSGAIMDPGAISELLGPNWLEEGCPVEARVTQEAVYTFTESRARKMPFTPPPLKNDGFFIVTLSDVVAWLKEKVEELGVMVFEGFPGHDFLWEDKRVAGVRTIDHGSLMDDEGREMLARSDTTFYVPTLYVLEVIVQDGARLGVPEAEIERGRRVMQFQSATFRRAVGRGLTIGFGTDAGVFEHGHNAREFQMRVENGESEMAAITSATSVSAMIMGWDDRVGSLEAGKLADVIAVPGNPLDDITVMERVMFVMQGGKIYRDDRVSR